ncbi:hypothetical protein BH23ACT9_BH23ACT9_34900 [soil metagenome]
MTVWPATHEDVVHARSLALTVPALDARDLIHLAIAQRREASLWTYDRALAAAVANP